MPTQPFIPVTWKNVTGPSNYSANNLLSKSGEALGSAIEGLGTNIDQFADEKQKRETDEFIAELNALPNDAARQDALKQAETGWMNLDRINKATTEFQDRDYTTAASARAQILGDIDVKTAQRKEASRIRTNEILADPNITLENLNKAMAQLPEDQLSDHQGLLKAKANELARNTETGIDDAFITNYVDPENNESYTRAAYNTLVNDTYSRLKKLHPYADESVLRQQAKAAITRTEAGTLFERQKWFEELERPGVRAEQEAIRKKAVGDTWRENKADVTSAHKAYSTSKKALRLDPKNAKLQAETSTARADFRTKINNLNEQFKNNEDSLGPGAATRLQSWNEQAVSDYVQYDLNPDASYLEMYQEFDEVVDPATDKKVRIPAPLGLPDYSPTNQQKYIDAEINKLTLALPHASAALIETKVLEKIKKSGLAVHFAAGALPAKLAAARQKYKFETARKRSERRHIVLDAIGDSPQKNVVSYMYGELSKRFASEGEKLTSDNLIKLRKELAKTVSQWKGFIPNWDKLGLASKETYQIAMVNILQGAQVDKDWNFLYLDKHDYPLPALASGSTTNDMSKIGKMAILAALAEHISPYGVGIDSYNKQSGVPNKTLLDDIQKEIEKAAAEKKEAVKRSLEDMTKGTLGG